MTAEEKRARNREKARRWQQRNKEKKRAWQRDWYERNKAQVLASRQQYYEEKKPQILASNRLRYKYNKAIVAKSNKKWFAANPDKRRAIQRRYNAKHPDRFHAHNTKRRALKRGAGILRLDAADWAGILVYFDRRCAYCLCTLTRPTQDHIEPLNRGGAHVEENVVPACRSCNSSKHTKLMVLWATAQLNKAS